MDRSEKTEKPIRHDEPARKPKKEMPHLDDPHPGSVSDGTHPEANEDKSE